MPHKKQTNPVVGGMVQMRNGMTGEIIGITNANGWCGELEILVDGTRCYVEINDVKVLGVLDRIVKAVSEA